MAGLAGRSGQSISTHAPRTGSDAAIVVLQRVQIIISTHAPRTGSDATMSARIRLSVSFQPTLPARGATLLLTGVSAESDISTHAPRTGSDSLHRQNRQEPGHFNPRSPHGERPSSASRMPCATYFNPRSPHGERRPPCCERLPLFAYFNPRSPHGERRLRPSTYTVSIGEFQPTLPARGATAQSNNSVDQNQRLCTKSIP